MNCYEDLLSSSQIGNISSLQSLFSSHSFSQKEIDNGFRKCITHFKQQSESFIKCIKLYMNKTEDINYRNDTADNSTIIMHCFTEAQETPSELIISCLLQDIDVSIIDNHRETCLFKLIKSTKLIEATQKEFLSALLTKKVDLSFENKQGDTLMTLATKMNRTSLVEYITAYIQGAKFAIGDYVDLVTEEKYTEALNKLRVYQDKENTLVTNNAFAFNTLMMAFLIQLRAMMESKITIKSNNSTVTINGMNVNNNDFINEYHYQMGVLLKGVNVNNSIDPVLLLNKAFMYYQWNEEEKFNHLSREIGKDEELSQVKFLWFYLRMLAIEMMIEKRQFIQAKDILSELGNMQKININGNDPGFNCGFGFDNRKFFIKNSFISGIDNKEIDNTIALFNIYLNTFNRDDNKKVIGELKLIDVKDNSNALSYQFHLCLKIKLLYHSASFPINKINSKLEKMLSNKNIGNNNSNSNSNGNWNGNSELSQIVYYNTNGIINLKLKNYAIARFNFLKAIAIIKMKSSSQIIKRNHYYPHIAYNLSLALFYSKQYKQCFTILSYLNKNNSRAFNNNPYFYYRLGLSQLEMVLNTIQPSPDKNDSFVSYSNTNTTNRKYFILNTQSQASSASLPQLNNDILINLRKALFLFKKSHHDHPVYLNCYFNLIFCLILNKSYSEAIYHLHLILLLLTPIDATNREIAQMYLLECYIDTNQLTQAKILSEQIVLSSPLTGSLYEYLNRRLIPNEEFKFCYYLNMIKLNVLFKSRDEIEKQLIFILNSINLSISVSSTGAVTKCENIPSYLINVFVYYYLFINKKDLALSFLKTRKVKHIFLPK